MMAAERVSDCLLCKGADEDQNFDYCRACGRTATPMHPGPGYKIGHDNREAVRAYFLSHVGITNAEVAKALSLSTMAVGRHVKTLRGEWLSASTASPESLSVSQEDQKDSPADGPRAADTNALPDGKED